MCFITNVNKKTLQQYENLKNHTQKQFAIIVIIWNLELAYDFVGVRS